MGRSKHEEILGEINPGFNLWTSAHGFHHLSLTNRKGWQLGWALILLAVALGLIAILVYYFVYVFSTAVYSRVIVESPGKDGMDWPITTVCHQQAFSVSKVNKIPNFSTKQTSLLSWSLAPSHSRPDVAEYNTGLTSTESGLNLTLQKSEYNNSYASLLKALIPTCEEFILECSLKEGHSINGSTCCNNYFNLEPMLNQHGTCFTTNGAKMRHKVKSAGEANGMTIMLMMEKANAFNFAIKYTSPELEDNQGVYFALSTDQMGVNAALDVQGQSVQPDQYATVGIARSQVDNRELVESWSYNLISEIDCVPPDAKNIDSDLTLGMISKNKYSKEHCESTAKIELLSRELIGCTFQSDTSEYDRCSPKQSAAYYKSFMANTSSNSNPNEGKQYELPVYNITSKIQDRYNKKCPQECLQDRYTLLPSYAQIQKALKDEIKSKLSAAGARTDSKVAVIKLFLSSLEYQRIQNFPQHALQLVAEVGGILALFLGISIISIIECLCYVVCALKRCCCSCCDNDEEDDDDVEPLDEPRQNWNRKPLTDTNINHRHSLQNQAIAEQHRDNYNGNRGYQTQNQYGNNSTRRRPDLSRFDEREEQNYT